MSYKESTIKLLLKIMDSLYKEMGTYDHYSDEHSSLFELLEFAEQALTEARGGRRWDINNLKKKLKNGEENTVICR